ncbi:MAG: 6,7-dimethyl-8-ribityllumazine synthase [Candidatus Pacebacteria bacterium]|jgi:6,7-dimethyl-8-ribityllumazine synthase|nr:6,7-dimethyl-8-ribityllumazine synthase [Candidatus Paceibacterota bacterium]
MKKTKDIKIAIISATFHKQVTDGLEKHCVETLKSKGLAKNQIEIIQIPGALEIPLVAKKLAKKHAYDAIIAFGAIHKGKTTHFELISAECARGCMDVSWQYEIPVIFEVLTVFDIADALDRATRTEENKGAEAALTALKMIEAMNSL